MMGIDALREGILSKAREKANEIVRNAELRAKELLASASREYEEKVREEVERRYKALRSDYGKAYSDEVFKLNMELLALKNEILNDVRRAVIERLKNVDRGVRRQSLKNLLKESLSYEAFKEFEKLVVHVTSTYLELIKEILVEEGLEKVVEVKALDDKYLGGLIVECYDGSLYVDNTYLTRVERGLNIIVGKLHRTVFKEVRT